MAIIKFRSILMETPFIKKLKAIIENEENSDMLCWVKGRTAIEIRDEKLFQEKLLPLHFRHNKIQSFIRQLNLYGFKKIRSASLQTFTHPTFVEGKGLDAILSQRKKSSIEMRSLIQSMSPRHRQTKEVEDSSPKPQENERKQEKIQLICQPIERKIQNGPIMGTPQPMAWPCDMSGYFMMPQMPQNLFMPLSYFGGWQC